MHMVSLSLRRGSHIFRIGVLLSVLIIAESELAQRFTGAFFPFIGSSILDITAPIRSPEHDTPEPLVVLISDHGGHDVSDEWPFPYSAYDRFIRRSWCLGARAIFVDISFLSSRNKSEDDSQLSNLSSLVELLTSEAANPDTINELWTESCSLPGLTANRRAQNQMPIYFAEPVGNSNSSVWRRLHQVLVSSEIEDGNVYRASSGEHKFKLRTAAFELYDSLCKSRPPLRRGCGRSYEETTSFSVPDTAFTPVLQRDFILPSSDGLTCIYGGKGIPSRFPVRTIASYLFGPLKAQIGCPPVLTLDWEQALAVEDVDVIAQAVDGHVVFLGANLAFAADRFQTALHSEIPGVYLHALAFKELFSDDASLPTLAAIWERVLALVIPVMSTLLLVLVARGKIVSKLKRSIARIARLLSVPTGLSAMVLIYLSRGWALDTILRDALFFAWSCNIDILILDPLRLASDELSRLRLALLKDFDRP